ncbi:MAG: transcription elongation factor GreA [Chloroflexi bacterium]|jgi:hypothetical protein|nr:transcription elongation factor GreA [Chloroflexota bacterium]
MTGVPGNREENESDQGWNCLRRMDDCSRRCSLSHDRVAQSLSRLISNWADPVERDGAHRVSGAIAKFSSFMSMCCLRLYVGTQVYLGCAAAGRQDLHAHPDVAGRSRMAGDWHDVDVLSSMTRNPPRSDRAWRPWRWSEVEDWADFMQEGGDEQVEVGSTVRVRDAWGEEEYTLVAPTQSDAASGRISIESPVGRALLGRRRGDRIEVQTPGGLRVLSIVDVAGLGPDLDRRSSGPRRP